LRPIFFPISKSFLAPAKIHFPTYPSNEKNFPLNEQLAFILANFNQHMTSTNPDLTVKPTYFIVAINPKSIIAFEGFGGFIPKTLRI